MSGGGTTTAPMSGAVDETGGSQPPSWLIPGQNDGLWAGSTAATPATQTTYGYDVIDGQNVPWGMGDRRFTDNINADLSMQGAAPTPAQTTYGYDVVNGQEVPWGMGDRRFTDNINADLFTQNAAGQAFAPIAPIAPVGTTANVMTSPPPVTTPPVVQNATAAAAANPAWVQDRFSGYWRMPDGEKIWGKRWNDRTGWVDPDPRFADMEAKYGFKKMDLYQPAGIFDNQPKFGDVNDLGAIWEGSSWIWPMEVWRRQYTGQWPQTQEGAAVAALPSVQEAARIVGRPTAQYATQTAAAASPAAPTPPAEELGRGLVSPTWNGTNWVWPDGSIARAGNEGSPTPPMYGQNMPAQPNWPLLYMMLNGGNMPWRRRRRPRYPNEQITF